MSITNLTSGGNKYFQNLKVGSITQLSNPISHESASVITTTASASQFLGGICSIDCSAGAVSCQLPAAYTLIEALQGATGATGPEGYNNPNYPAVGDVHKCLFVAYGSGTTGATLTTNNGLTLLGAPQVGPQGSRFVYARITGMTGATGSIAIY